MYTYELINFNVHISEVPHFNTCKYEYGGDVVARHNTLCNFIFEFYKMSTAKPKTGSWCWFGP